MQRKARTQYSIAQEARDLYAMFRVCKMTADEMNTRLAAFRATWPKRMTNHERGFVDGYLWSLYDGVWQHVEFCYRDANGVLYSTHKESTHRLTEEFYASGRGRELCDMECAHVWKGSDKPYTAWSVPNKPRAQ